MKPMTAEEWYQKGNEYRKQGDWKHAIDCYLEAFYHKDAYNP